MVIVGITGGIGSGKSTVAGYFRNRGAHVLSADLLAKNLVAKDPVIRSRLIRTFGKGLYSSSKTIDTRKLAAIVFNNNRALKKLNALVHPAVIRTIRSQIRKYHSRPGLFIIEAALFYETGIDMLVDYMIVVDASERIRIRRVMRRDGISRSDVVKRIAAQMPAS